MAQKSHPIVNKVNTSMFWYSTLYCKYYKWLSAQFLYLFYFLNKMFIKLNVFSSTVCWSPLFNFYWYTAKHPSRKFNAKATLTNQPLTAYLINMGHLYQVLNLFFKTSLDFLKKRKLNKELNKSFKIQYYNIQPAVRLITKIGYGRRFTLRR